MAGGKLTPRQKMINMMYLVLTAMLALNVSQEILTALTNLNTSMEETISQVNEGNTLVYGALQAEAGEKEKAKPWNDKAQALKPDAQASWQMIEDIKAHLIESTGGYVEGTNFLVGADNRDAGQNYLVNSKQMGGGGKAKEIRNNLEALRASMIASTEGDESADAAMARNIVTELLTFDPVKGIHDDAARPWEEAKFAELPLAGVIPFLTELQANVRRAESAMLEYYAKGINLKSQSFNTVIAKAIPKTTFVPVGGNLEVELMIAAYDDSQNPEFYIGEGEDAVLVDTSMVRDGIAHVEIPAGGAGAKTFTGSIMLPGADSAYTFNVDYMVVPPTAVIAATKMNVLYRQVKNPISISVPGAQPEQLRLSGPGSIRQVSPGNFEVDITNINTQEATYKVIVTDEEGNSREAGQQNFRLKSLPKPITLLSGRSGTGPYSKGLVQGGTVQAAYENFPFDLNLTVTKFELVIPGQAPFRVNGNRLSDAAKTALERVRSGSLVMIRNVEARIDGSSETLSNINPLTFEIN